MKTMIDLLHHGNYSCVIANRDDIRTFTRRGVADLYNLLHRDPSFLEGAFIADKIVGRAAAALIVLAGIRKVYTDVISAPAHELLNNSGIKVIYEQEVPHIINRLMNDWCPLEKLCCVATTADDCLPLIKQFIESKK